jgi:hypothetical protein
MAAPITHIVLSHKIFKTHFKHHNKKEFFIGTSFPDIRYLWIIDREKTHFTITSLPSQTKTSSFMAWIEFHSFVDHIREKYILQCNTYALCPQSKYITHSLKILEDLIFYKHINDRKLFCDYFNQILASERNFWIDDKYIKFRHKTLQAYFAQEPNEESILWFIENIWLNTEIAHEIYQNVCIIKQNKHIISILNWFYTDFENLILQH